MDTEAGNNRLDDKAVIGRVLTHLEETRPDAAALGRLAMAALEREHKRDDEFESREHIIDLIEQFDEASQYRRSKRDRKLRKYLWRSEIDHFNDRIVNLFT